MVVPQFVASVIKTGDEYYTSRSCCTPAYTTSANARVTPQCCPILLLISHLYVLPNRFMLFHFHKNLVVSVLHLTILNR